jgi:hypothetical protein
LTHISAPIVWMPCRFGGARPFFVCPGLVNGIVCGRRVAKLYGAGTYFLCRECYRLAYASQRKDRYVRALRRANNIRMRLGGEPSTASALPVRPKGMHRRTYDRLQFAVLNAEILAEARLAILLTRLQRSERRSERRSPSRSRYFKLSLWRREARDLRKGLFGLEGLRNVPGRSGGVMVLRLPKGWTLRLTYHPAHWEGQVTAEFIPPTMRHWPPLPSQWPDDLAA